jgi:hypothetical protein
MLEFIAGFVVGAATLYLMTVWTIRRLIAKALAEEAQHREEDLVIRARVEQHDGIFYFYNNDSDEFLVQGSDMTELIDHLESRRAGTTVHVVAGDESTIANLKALAK